MFAAVFSSWLVKHFPKKSKLSKMFNKNKFKVSYSCMPNISSIISNHNWEFRLLPSPNPPCNCSEKQMSTWCTMWNKKHCVQGAGDKHPQWKGRRVHYTNRVALQTALCKPPYDLRDERYENSTGLSKRQKEVCTIKRQKEVCTITWSIDTRAHAYTNEQKNATCTSAKKWKLQQAARRHDWTEGLKSSQSVDMPTSFDLWVSYEWHDSRFSEYWNITTPLHHFTPMLAMHALGRTCVSIKWLAVL